MSKHTPGPWKIGATPPNGEQTIGTQQGLMVAVATTGANTPTEANARLIAAAPELLDLLNKVLPLVAFAYDKGLADAEIIGRDIESAIAKATGEQQ